MPGTNLPGEFLLSIDPARVPDEGEVMLRICGALPDSNVTFQLLRLPNDAPLQTLIAMTDADGCCIKKMQLRKVLHADQEDELWIQAIIRGIKVRQPLLVFKRPRMHLPEHIYADEPFTVTFEGAKPGQALTFQLLIDGQVVTVDGSFVADEQGRGSRELVIPAASLMG